MEYVYVIAGFIIYAAIYSILNKLYLDNTFKKFELEQDKWCFKPNLKRVLFFYVFPYALLIGGFSYYFYSSNKLDFYQLFLILICVPAISYVYISKPLKTIKKGFKITLNDNIVEFNGKEKIRIDLSESVSITEKRTIPSRKSETYLFKVNGKEIIIDFNDFILGVYADRIVNLFQTKIKSAE